MNHSWVGGSVLSVYNPPIGWCENSNSNLSAINWGLNREVVPTLCESFLDQIPRRIPGIEDYRQAIEVHGSMWKLCAMQSSHEIRVSVM